MSSIVMKSCSANSTNNFAFSGPILFSNNGYAYMKFYTTRFKVFDVEDKLVIIHEVTKNENVNTYVWTDGYCLYTLQGTCSQEILLEITKSINLPTGYS